MQRGPAMRLAIALVLIPSLAAAETAVNVDVKVDVTVDNPQPDPVLVVVRPPPPRPRLRGHRWEGAVLLEGGRFAAGDISGGQFGVRGMLARQLGPLRIAIEGSLAKFSASQDVYTSDGWWAGWEDFGGEVRRVGASLRYRASMDTHGGLYSPSASVGGYLEVGLGRQTIAWSGGVSGATEDVREDYLIGAGLEVAGGRRRMGGMDLGVRLLASPRMDLKDRTHDLGVLVNLGVILGS
jgi:hypothetical protein